ncbi:hypothetical protein MB02_07305 [Croceicoccus estronivorus]|uniref:alpha/beta hydrolase n=1 Tax=Croceicoccus estronivorus TaxID=1172626 RepID=UPI00083016EC|nr:alpha/beta hydrolase [Croceicoccus estronivorus]OCC24380.1 hypothetical protein MB02_07305 [Croceicoccus estronivorus]
MTLHPDMQAMLDRRAALNLPGFAEGTPETARQAFLEAQAALPKDRGAAVRSIRDETVDGPAGPVPVRRYMPQVERPVGQIFYLHGGGWVFGTLDGFDPACRELADASGCEVISIDYRLAPESRFPIPLNDGWAVLSALAEPALPLIVAGDSAGGNLAAGLALRARDEGMPRLALQLLAYPVLDPDLRGESHERYGGGDYLISTEDMRWFWDQYTDPADRNHPYAAPAKSEDLSGLPRTILLVAGCDPLHDEGVRYADRLKAAGVKVTLRDHADMAHGFFTLVDLLEPANAEIRVVGAMIAKALEEEIQPD